MVGFSLYFFARVYPLGLFFIVSTEFPLILLTIPYIPYTRARQCGR